MCRGPAPQVLGPEPGPQLWSFPLVTYLIATVLRSIGGTSGGPARRGLWEWSIGEVIMPVRLGDSDGLVSAGADPGGGGGGPGGQDPPPPFWGTPKLHKEGKNVSRMHMKTPHFSS